MIAEGCDHVPFGACGFQLAKPARDYVANQNSLVQVIPANTARTIMRKDVPRSPSVSFSVEYNKLMAKPIIRVERDAAFGLFQFSRSGSIWSVWSDRSSMVRAVVAVTVTLRAVRYVYLESNQYSAYSKP